MPDKDIINELKDKVLSGKLIKKEEALHLINEDCDEVCTAANEIRKYYCGKDFDLCSVISGRIGRCSEDCKFILPKAQIRLAAGRPSLPEGGTKCFKSGANAAISGNMITINGINPKEDINVLRRWFA